MNRKQHINIQTSATQRLNAAIAKAERRLSAMPGATRASVHIDEIIADALLVADHTGDGEIEIGVALTAGELVTEKRSLADYPLAVQVDIARCIPELMEEAEQGSADVERDATEVACAIELACS